MTQLYHATLHAGSRAVRLMMVEYGLDVELTEERLWERRAEFLDINPAATLPVLIDEHTHVIGAQPIGEYLDETHGAMKRDRRLFPEDAAGRAEMRRLIDWALMKLESEVTRYAVNELVTKRMMPRGAGGGAPDSQALRAARTNIKYHLDYLGWLASQRNWLAGSRLTQADLAVAASLSVLDYLGEVKWDSAEALKDWYARIKSRPSFRPLLADRARGIPPVSHYADLDF
ncbi:MAG: glutathione S-transferase family protein [Ahrensia sp.]|nr:glutathione S-transferase family protein [Ahrensia sp.]